MGWGTSWVTHQDDDTVSPDYIPIKNKIPTHDPYTNPDAFLYYQCDCGEVLDPRVKSFASLNNHASKADWRIRWGERYYVPYCPKCVEEKGIE